MVVLGRMIKMMVSHRQVQVYRLQKNDKLVYSHYYEPKDNWIEEHKEQV